MAQLAALVVSSDPEFRREASRLLRAGGIPIGIIEEQRQAVSAPDIAVVDIRFDTSAGMAAIERLRSMSASLAIFAVAAAAEPELILQAMRAGSNEFFAWPRDFSSTAGRSMEESFHGAVRRTAARRDTIAGGSKQACVTYVFLGAKGGAGTTTVAVNCAVELVRLTRRSTVVVDLKASLGEVALFLGVRPRFTVLDAIENLHRLDKDFLKELVAKHKSGLEILAGSEQFDRPNAQDAGGIEELLRVLARMYEYVVIDAGNWINAAAVAGLYAADTIFLVANPDVPSIRNAQRLIERVRQISAGSDRVKVLLNRVTDQLMIAPKQIETALGYSVHHQFTSDYATVAQALNSGVPLTMTDNSQISEQFSAFTRQLAGLAAEKAEVGRKQRFLGIL